MLAMEEVLCELSDHENKREQQGLPPGFRFHPTDEELITFYLASKVFNPTNFSSIVKFAEVDLNRCEPWELPEVAKMGEREWYLFSLRDRKYPTGLRTNRATGAGYWKATGKDKEVYAAAACTGSLLGMKKTLVFYKGRAPRGEKTKWVMHEYRLGPHYSHIHTCKEEWVICRIFHKSVEKRNSIIQVEGGSSNISLKKGSLLPPPPLLPNPTSFSLQNDQLTHSHFPLHAFQTSFPITHDMSQQNFTLQKEPNIPKTEATFYELYQSQSIDDVVNLRWIDHINNFQSSFPLEMNDDDELIAFSSGADSNAEFRDMSTSTPFNSRLALDASVGIDSWSQPQLV